ncbi:MAG TPA: DNA translocase FtsK [Devosiaceae bacterium]
MAAQTSRALGAPRPRSRAAAEPAAPNTFAIRIPVRLAGLAVLALVGLTLAALASWSVDDPSLSYATSKVPANWLGFPGAVVADLLFQLFGLAAVLSLIVPALWGYTLTLRRIPSRFGFRLLAWIGGLLLCSGLLSFFAVPATWPLPTGLGGFVGSGFSSLAAIVMGAEPDGTASVLFAAILLAPTLALYWLSSGVRTAIPFVSRKTRADADPDAPERGDGFLSVVVGALVHTGYSARTAWRKARVNARQKAEAEEQNWRETAVEPQLEGERPPQGYSARREPVLEEFEVARDYPEDDDVIDIDDFDTPRPTVADDDGIGRLIAGRGQQTAPRPQTAASQRVSAPAPKPAEGKRIVLEAQGSLLDPEGFELPPLGLLAEPRHNSPGVDQQPEKLEQNARRLEAVLEDFGVKGDIINVRPGPVVTLYELEPAPGIKSSRVISLADDIARSMSAISARVAVVPGRNAIGIELPNQTRDTVFLREMLASADFEKMKGKLPICLGKTIGGEPVIADLARMPHLLIAGTTGSGKSVAVNTMILSLLYRMTPEQCRLIMVDPKMLELSIYDGIPHLLTPVVTDPAKAVVALKWAVREMEDRYKKMSKIGVRNIDGFNQRVTEAAQKGDVITRTVQTGFDKETGEAIFESEEFSLEPLPYIVVIVDEMADLMMVAGKDIEGAIQRLAQMARAAGIHLIMATQRPSVDVITGTIKANFPTRISFQVTSKIDSRTILGEQGAEQLLGMGDMLYMAGGGRIRRLHGPFVSDNEVEEVVAHLKCQGAPDYLESITAEDDEDGMPGQDFGGSGDELYDKAVNIVLNDKKASTSYIQRRLSIGYNRAATLIERMEHEGVISPPNHAGKREILVGDNADGY